jgi:periplasmic divalent cation tolerance protein
MAADYVTVTTTTNTPDAASSIAASAVEARLAACAQVSAPIASTYWWNGAVENETEYRIDFKTKAALADRLTEHIKANHTYDTPEVIVTPIIGGNGAYLDWLGAETSN